MHDQPRACDARAPHGLPWAILDPTIPQSAAPPAPPIRPRHTSVPALAAGWRRAGSRPPSRARPRGWLTTTARARGILARAGLAALLGAVTGVAAGWVHLRAGVPPDAGLFVAGLPGPYPAATDIVAVLSGGAVLGPALLVVTRTLAAAGLVLLACRSRIATPGGGWSPRHRLPGVRPLIARGLALTALSLAGGVVAVVAGLVGGELVAVLVMLTAGAVWASAATRAAGGIPGRRVPLAAVAAGAIALLLTPAGPVAYGDALALAALGGTEGGLLLFAVLQPGRAGAPIGPS
jgi:hypothetical protein